MKDRGVVKEAEAVLELDLLAEGHTPNLTPGTLVRLATERLAAEGLNRTRPISN